ncbi:hypothetical protein B0H13DRAFT_1882169 [Mycena leptocephala]|nr:hypothetical protein B0H13DRAFT_1882169 [Mycena leptocephala]
MALASYIIELLDERIKNTPIDLDVHPAVLARRVGLASLKMYQESGDINMLTSAVQYLQEAVDVTAIDDPTRAEHYDQEAFELVGEEELDKGTQALRLLNISAGLMARYERLRDLADLETAICHAEKAVKLMPQDHPRRAGCLQLLAMLLFLRYTRLGNLKDLEAALAYNEKALEHTPKGHPEKAFRLQYRARLFSARYKRFGFNTTLYTRLG